MGSPAAAIVGMYTNLSSMHTAWIRGLHFVLDLTFRSPALLKKKN